MKDVYIKTRDLNSWIAKYFKNQDLITLEELIGCIEELDGKINSLNEKIRELENIEEDGEYDYGE